jgi:hypothetical protein
VSRIERGRLEEVGLSAVRAVGGALDMRIDVIALRHAPSPLLGTSSGAREAAQRSPGENMA